MREERFDVIVFGSGTAGKLMAWTMAKEGKRTAVVERKLIGGSCQNIACLPSKNVIHSAEVASLFARRREFGIESGPFTVNMAGVYERKRKMVEDLVQIHWDRYRASGAEVILGEGKFVGPRTIRVALREGGERTISAERVFVNLGSRAAIPNIRGLRESKPLTHVEALDLQRLPEHLIVLGGGYVGLELGQAFRRFGSRVTLIERGPQLAPREEAEVGEALLQLFRDEGIEVLPGTDVLKVEGTSGDHVRMQVRGRRGEQTIEGTDILAALGRTANTDAIGLESAGIEVTETGHIRVNDRLETTAPDVWAMGECAGSPYFTHVSEDDFNIINENLHGGHRTTRGRLIPYCVFTDPPLARAGIDEAQARKNNVAYRVASLPMDAVWRTWTLSEKRGFMKTIVDAHSDRVLGFTAFGPEAGELMGTVQSVMLGEQPYTLLRDAIFAHPTMTEGLKALFAGVPERTGHRVEKPEPAYA